mmetsp:Transcript_18677/g.50668  ORF Transcript_18677/g.50668 Transcript_18677/m.50668 type:complete len:233 (+) Transcript_18677:174-872(+)
MLVTRRAVWSGITLPPSMPKRIGEDSSPRMNNLNDFSVQSAANSLYICTFSIASSSFFWSRTTRNWTSSCVWPTSNSLQRNPLDATYASAMSNGRPGFSFFHPAGSSSASVPLLQRNGLRWNSSSLKIWPSIQGFPGSFFASSTTSTLLLLLGSWRSLSMAYQQPSGFTSCLSFPLMDSNWFALLRLLHCTASSSRDTLTSKSSAVTPSQLLPLNSSLSCRVPVKCIQVMSF